MKKWSFEKDQNLGKGAIVKITVNNNKLTAIDIKKNSITINLKNTKNVYDKNALF